MNWPVAVLLGVLIAWLIIWIMNRSVSTFNSGLGERLPDMQAVAPPPMQALEQAMATHEPPFKRVHIEGTDALLVAVGLEEWRERPSIMDGAPPGSMAQWLKTHEMGPTPRGPKEPGALEKDQGESMGGTAPPPGMWTGGGFATGAASPQYASFGGGFAGGFGAPPPGAAPIAAGVLAMLSPSPAPSNDVGQIAEGFKTLYATVWLPNQAPTNRTDTVANRQAYIQGATASIQESLNSTPASSPMRSTLLDEQAAIGLLISTNWASMAAPAPAPSPSTSDAIRAWQAQQQQALDAAAAQEQQQVIQNLVEGFKTLYKNTWLPAQARTNRTDTVANRLAFIQEKTSSIQTQLNSTPASDVTNRTNLFNKKAAMTVLGTTNWSSLAPVDCVVGDWGAWEPCNAPCGTTGIQFRTRQYTQAQNGGQACPTTPEKQCQSCTGLRACVPGTRPANPRCPDGQVYDSVRVKCVLSRAPQCSGGFTFDPTSNKCKKTGSNDRNPTCDSGFTLNSTTHSCEVLRTPDYMCQDPGNWTVSGANCTTPDVASALDPFWFDKPTPTCRSVQQSGGNQGSSNHGGGNQGGGNQGGGNQGGHGH